MKSLLDSVLVKEFMTRTQVSVEAQQSLHLADALMSARGLQHLPVVDIDNNLLGLVSHRDIVAAELGTARNEVQSAPEREFVRDEPEQQDLLRPVASIMTSDVVTLTTDMTAKVAIGHLLRSRYGFAPVLEGMSLVGVLTEDDILRFCIGYFRSSPLVIADIMTRELVTAKGDTSLLEATAKMEQESIRHLLVADASGHLQGVVSQRDVLMLQRSVSEAKAGVWSIAQLASKNAWTTTTNTLVTDAAQTLIDNHFGCLPVVEKKHLLGIVTLSDFLRAVLSDDARRSPPERFIAPCAAYVRDNICRVAPEQSIARAFQCFSQYQTPTLLVVEGDQAVGILSHKDVLEAMHASVDTESLLASPLANLMSRDLVRISGNRNVGEAAMLLTQKRVHQVVVELDHEAPSLLGTSEILQAVQDRRLQTSLREIMTGVIFSIDAQESIASARRYLRQAELSGLIVHDGNWPIGIFGQPEALASLSDEERRPVEEAMCARIICLPPDLPISRAAQQAEALGARHIIVQDGGETIGLATATDFAGLLASMNS